MGPRPTLAAYNRKRSEAIRKERLISLTKLCTSCKGVKPLTVFYANTKTFDKVQNTCRSCASKRSSVQHRETRTKYKQLIFDKLGNKCAICWFSDERALQIDHVLGNAKSNGVLKDRNSIAFYKKVLADTQGLFQILCANCNWIKRHTNNEIPKKEHHNEITN